METKSKTLIKTFIVVAMAIIFSISLRTASAQARQLAPVKNIVIVHGAFADGSGWQGVYNILAKKGYNVTVVQNPCTSLKDDVDATNLALDKQDGPVILVGHSWGGTVITQAGVHSKVVALVYVNGFQPDVGESTLTWAASLPSKPENGILPPDDKGYVYYDKAKFHAGFAADLSKDETDFMYASQGTFPGVAFSTQVTEAAWRTKPTYGVSATDDKSINPDITMNMYKRSGSIITRIKGSHVVFMSHPKEVADVIIAASLGGSSK